MQSFITQQDYDLICEIISTGAPALANKLISHLAATVDDWNRLRKEEDAKNDVGNDHK